MTDVSSEQLHLSYCTAKLPPQKRGACPAARKTVQLPEIDATGLRQLCPFLNQ